MTIVKREAAALPSVEKARMLLAQARSTNEPRKIRAIAQAVATLERGKEIGIDAAEIVVLCDVRIGELTSVMFKATHGGLGGGSKVRDADFRSKDEELKAEGLNKQQASRCETMAFKLSQAERDEYLKLCRTLGIQASSKALEALAKLSPTQRKRALAKLERDAKKNHKSASIHRAIQSVKHDDAKEAVAEETRKSPEKAFIRKQDALEFINTFKRGSIDLLLTDPPYSTDVEDIDEFAQWWLPEALARVALTGRAYVCIGAYPKELRAYLNVAQEYGWVPEQVLVWTYRNTLGPAPSHDYKLNWQAILYWRGKKAPALDCPIMNEQFTVQDINAPDGRLGDRYHAWQKPDELCERLVRHSTEEGQLVVDPFACTGSFLIAAAKLGRKAIGCDISEKNIKIAIERGCTRAK